MITEKRTRHTNHRITLPQGPELMGCLLDTSTIYCSLFNYSHYASAYMFTLSADQSNVTQQEQVASRQVFLPN